MTSVSCWASRTAYAFPVLLAVVSCASFPHAKNLSPNTPIASPSVDDQRAGNDAVAVGKGLILQGADSVIGVISVSALALAVLAPLIGAWLGARRYEHVHRPRRLAAELEQIRKGAIR